MEEEKNKKKYLNCEYCNFQISSRVHFERHMRSHTGEKPYGCPLCEKAFSIESNFRRHVRTHSGEKPFECEICLVRFTAKESLIKHMRRHSGENLYKCDLCDRTFTQSSHVKAHQRIHTGEKNFQCPTCNKRFNNKYSFKLHCTKHENKTYTCQVCGKVYDHLGTYQQHMRRQTKFNSYCCSVCGQQFPARCGLYEHYVKDHAKNKHYHCQVCGKKFCELVYMKRHTLSHIKFKSFICTVCDVRFAKESEFMDHLDQHLVDRFFYCDCGKKSTTKNKFKLHLATHESESLQCFGSTEECHSMKGSKEYPKFKVSFLCPLCDREFERKVNAVIHVKSIHKMEEEITDTSSINDMENTSQSSEKPFKCSSCLSSFTKVTSLKFHEVCVHKIVNHSETPIKVKEEKHDDGDGIHIPMENDDNGQSDAVFGEENVSRSYKEKLWVQNGMVTENNLPREELAHERQSSEENEAMLLDYNITIKEEPLDSDSVDIDHGKVGDISSTISGDNSSDLLPNKRSNEPTPFDLKKEDCNSGSFECPRCFITLPSKIYLSKHMASHVDKSPSCGQCNLRFQNEASYKRHMDLHKVKSYRCKECLRTFSCETSLLKHIRNQSCHIKNYKCFFCTQEFVNKPGIVNHIRHMHAYVKEDPDSSLAESFKCQGCDSRFPSKNGCVWHEVCDHMIVNISETPTGDNKEQHGEDAIWMSSLVENDNNCQIDADFREENLGNSDRGTEEKLCVQNDSVTEGDSTWEEKTLESHSDEDGETLLPDCNVIIKEELPDADDFNVDHGYLEATSSTISGDGLNSMYLSERPREPDPIDLDKVSIEDYVYQYRKSFNCPVCRKKFKSLKRLECHMAYHSGENPFCCTICNLSFTRKTSLLMHVRSHSNESLKCLHCSKTLSTKKSLKRHVALHEDKYRYCLQCNRRFQSESSYVKHMELHNNKTLSCKECLRTFSCENYLRQHIRKQSCRIKNYRCFFCMRVFGNKSGAVGHVRYIHAFAKEDPDNSADGAFRCVVCDLKFPSKHGCVWHEVCVHKIVEEANPTNFVNENLEGGTDAYFYEEANRMKTDNEDQDGTDVDFHEEVNPRETVNEDVEGGPDDDFYEDDTSYENEEHSSENITMGSEVLELLFSEPSESENDDTRPFDDDNSTKGEDNGINSSDGEACFGTGFQENQIFIKEEFIESDTTNNFSASEVVAYS